MSIINIDFTGKRILITGGGSGLGRALVKKFHDGNAIVFTVDRDETALKSVKTEFPNVTYAVVDLSDWDATRKVVESFGRMDHLVNNAGVVLVEPFLEVTKESLEKQMSVNYSAAFNISQVVAKGMIQAKTEGSIVNISSVGATKPSLGVGVYSASKAAVSMLTKSMAIELGDHNIRVNCVCPGWMETPMVSGESVREAAKVALNQLPIKRYVQPSEAADLVCFLLSPFSAMITGTSVFIDGGMAAM